MSWGSPIYLNLLLLIPTLILFFLFISRIKRKNKTVIGDENLIDRLSLGKNPGREKLKKALLITGLLFLIISIARPQMGTRFVMSKRRGVDILIAMDVSQSMLARDIKPNRLTKAKFEVSSLIERLKGDRIGILTFAGTAFVQCPLTLDYNAAVMFLNIVEQNMMPVPGTAIGDAIRLAVDSFIKKQRKHKVLILLTDGEDHETDPIEAAQEAKKSGVIIYTVGIGTSKGEPVPIVDEEGNVSGYKKDKNGSVVMSKLDDSTLRSIAVITGGKYYRATAGEFELSQIYDEIRKMEKKELSSRLYTQREERFQYFLGVALILLIAELTLGERKRR